MILPSILFFFSIISVSGSNSGTDPWSQYDCDFDLNWCLWNTFPNNHCLRWRRVTQQKLPNGNSLDQDYVPPGSTKKNGKFLSLSMNNETGQPIEWARVETKMDQLLRQTGLKMVFHLATLRDGEFLPFLNLIVRRSDGREIYFKKFNDRTKGLWKKKEVDLCVPPDAMISFEGQLTSSQNVLRAIDSIYFTLNHAACGTRTTSPAPETTPDQNGTTTTEITTTTTPVPEPETATADPDIETIKTMVAVFGAITVALLGAMLIGGSFLFQQLKKPDGIRSKRDDEKQ